MTSINTNAGAILAQKFLRSTTADMQVTQNRVSSGLRVSTVTDDASSFAVAAGIRGDVKAYTAVAAALQGSTVAAKVALSAGEAIGERLGAMKAKLVQLADESLSTASRSTYNADVSGLAFQVNRMLSNASYAGVNLLGTGGADLQVVSGIDGASITLRNQDVAKLVPSSFQASGNAQARANLDALAAFKSTLDTALAELGADVTRINSQAEFVKQTEETVRIGLGALVDADLAKESATLTALQVRQQLGVQAIGIANTAPQSLLGLFR